MPSHRLQDVADGEDDAPKSAVGARIDATPDPPAQGLPSGPKTPPRGPTRRFAGFWRRLGAYLVDMLIVSIPTVLLLELAGFTGPEVPLTALAQMPTDQLVAVAEEMALYAVVVFVLQWPYFAGFEASSWQATPGKRVLSVKVTDSQGNRLSFGRATGRYFAKFLSEALAYLGYAMIGLTEEKQGLHDLVAKTRVEKA